jgi:two-component system, cell cycle sensor histidine kinase and response regulator CckA
MKKLFPGIKIILMSGYTDRALTTDAASVSANLFLQKPFTTATLLKSIREVIDNGSQNGS